jgi:hypothetical protein
MDDMPVELSLEEIKQLIREKNKDARFLEVRDGVVVDSETGDIIEGLTPTQIPSTMNVPDEINELEEVALSLVPEGTLPYMETTNEVEVDICLFCGGVLYGLPKELQGLYPEGPCSCKWCLQCSNRIFQKDQLVGDTRCRRCAYGFEF